MAEFLGMDVRLYLTNGLVLDGRVGNIDQRTQLLTLTGATTNINGIQQRYQSYPVPGADIKDLQILAAEPAQHKLQPPQQPQQQFPQPQMQPQQYPSMPADTVFHSPPMVSHHRPQPEYSNIVQQAPHAMQPAHATHTTHQAPVHAQPMIPQAHPKTWPNPNAVNAYPQPTPHMPHHQEAPPQTGQLPQPPYNMLHHPHPHHPQHREPPIPTAPVTQVQPTPSRPAFVDPAIVMLSSTKPNSPTVARRKSNVTPPTPTQILKRPSQPSPPKLNKTPSQSSLEKRNQARANNKQPQFAPTTSITVTESEFDDEEVDFSDFNGLAIEDSGPSANIRAKGNASQKEGGRVRTPVKQGGRARHGSQSPAMRTRKGRRSETFKEDVANYSDDFDFQAGLDQFDKRRVFAEIRQGDSTAPETLLVNLNRLKNQGNLNMQKLGIREMVLDSIPPSGDETGNDAEVESDVDSDGAVLEGGLADDMGTMRPGNGVPKKRICRTTSGVPVPCVSPQGMVQIEMIAASETGPSDEQMIENGGRGAAMMVLQALGGNRRIKPGNHNDGPLVVVLAGNNKVGAVGLCAARHLANHECNVIVCVVGSDAELYNMVATQQKIFLPTGGKLSRGVVDLPHPSSQPVDLIIDALLGSYQSLLDLSEGDKSLARDLIGWANDNKANVLSLDIASGVHGVTGQPMSPTHHIKPKWTLALGLPKIGHLRAPREVTGELFLADLGIPRLVFQKVNKGGRMKYVPPFGDKFLVGLEVVEVVGGSGSGSGSA